MKINTIIISSDKEKRHLIELYITSISLFNNIGVYESVLEAYHAIIENQIEVIISDDPEAKRILTFNGIKELPLIMIAHFDDDATPSISSISIDTTPINIFTDVVQKVSFVEQYGQEEALSLADSQDGFTAKEDFIFIRIKNKFIKVIYNDISHIKAMENFVQVVTEKETLTVLVSLKNIASQLPTHQFIRVHRSYIVNINAIQSVEKNLIFLPKYQIPIGAAYKEELAAALSLKRKLIKR